MDRLAAVGLQGVTVPIANRCSLVPNGTTTLFVRGIGCDRIRGVLQGRPRPTSTPSATAERAASVCLRCFSQSARIASDQARSICPTTSSPDFPRSRSRASAAMRSLCFWIHRSSSAATLRSAFALSSATPASDRRRSTSVSMMLFLRCLLRHQIQMLGVGTSPDGEAVPHSGPTRTGPRRVSAQTVPEGCRPVPS